MVGLEESKGRPEPSPNSPSTRVPHENPSEVHILTHLAEVPPKEVKEQETNDLLKEINKIFSSEDAALSHRHNHYECAGSRSKKDHICQVVAVTNLPIAGCLIRAFLPVKQQVFFGSCMKKARECSVFFVRNITLKTKQNKSKAYNATASVRFKKSAIKDHSASQQHKDAIEAEMLSRVSLFHKEITEKEKVKDTVLMNAFLAAYWIAKEEIANRKFSSFVNLLKIVSPENMKFFNYSGEETIQSIFLAIGSTVMERILNNAKKGGCYGLLCDEVTDISVMEIRVTFIQFFNLETEKVETNFLFVENVLKKTTSANAETS